MKKFIKILWIQPCKYLRTHQWVSIPTIISCSSSLPTLCWLLPLLPHWSSQPILFNSSSPWGSTWGPPKRLPNTTLAEATVKQQFANSPRPGAGTSSSNCTVTWRGPDSSGIEVAQKFLLPFKLHFLMSSFFNIVENLLLSPTAEMKTARGEGRQQGVLI